MWKWLQHKLGITELMAKANEQLAAIGAAFDAISTAITESVAVLDTKVTTEVNGLKDQILALQQQLANQPSPDAELVAAIDALATKADGVLTNVAAFRAKVQAVDDLVPDSVQDAAAGDGKDAAKGGDGGKSS